MYLFAKFAGHRPNSRNNDFKFDLSKRALEKAIQRNMILKNWNMKEEMYKRIGKSRI